MVTALSINVFILARALSLLNIVGNFMSSPYVSFLTYPFVAWLIWRYYRPEHPGVAELRKAMCELEEFCDWEHSDVLAKQELHTVGMWDYEDHVERDVMNKRWGRAIGQPLPADAVVIDIDEVGPGAEFNSPADFNVVRAERIKYMRKRRKVTNPAMLSVVLSVKAKKPYIPGYVNTLADRQIVNDLIVREALRCKWTSTQLSNKRAIMIEMVLMPLPSELRHSNVEVRHAVGNWSLDESYYGGKAHSDWWLLWRRITRY